MPIQGQLKFRPTLAYQGLALICIPLVFTLILVSILTFMLQQAEREVKREATARSVLEHVNSLTKCLAGGAAIGYNTIAGRIFLQRFRTAIDPLPAELKSLEELGGNDEAQQVTFRTFRAMITQLSEDSDAGQRLLESGNIVAATDRLDALTPKLADVWLASENLVRQVRKIEASNPVMQTQTRQKVQNMLYAGLGLDLCLSLLLGFYFYRATVKRLNTLMSNAEALGKGRPLEQPLAGSDELATIDKVFYDAANTITEAARRERAVIENAVDVICSLDDTGKFLEVSPAADRVWGYPPDSLVGRPMVELVQLDDVSATKNAIADVVQGKKIPHLQNKVRTSSGEVVHTRWSAQWSEQERKLFCVAHDISDIMRAEESLKESESRVRLILDSMPVSLVITTDVGTIEMANPVSQRLFGYSSEELLGENLKKLFPAGATIDFFKVTRDPSQSALSMEEREAKTKSGTIVPIEFSLTEFYFNQNRRLLAVMIDVTARHEVEQMKQEFVNMVSHDLRTPLGSVQTFLALLIEGIYGSLSEDGQRKAGAADRNVSRLIALINDLLDYEKMEAGRLELTLTEITIADVIERSLDSVRAVAEARGITFDVKPTELAVQADENRLVQVLVNILGNAVKFSPDQGQVTISTNQTSDYVIVLVADQGPGVPAGYQKQIFERFSQAPKKDNQRITGTGLGLAISRAIIEQLGGSIGVENRDTGGSIFWFRVPKPKSAQQS